VFGKQRRLAATVDSEALEVIDVGPTCADKAKMNTFDLHGALKKARKVYMQYTSRPQVRNVSI
jgi:hypothetical protein